MSRSLVRAFWAALLAAVVATSVPSFLCVSCAQEQQWHADWRKDRLRIGGKTFAEHRKLLLADIEPKTRIERLRPMLAFARHGLAREVVETVLEMMMEYEYSFFNEADKEAKFAGLQDEKLKKLSQEIDEEDDLFEECADLVLLIGPDLAVPVLQSWLSEDRRGACVFALEVLCEFREVDLPEGTIRCAIPPASVKRLVPDLLELARSSTPQVAADAYEALGIIAGDDREVQAALKAGLQHKEAVVRRMIVSSIAATPGAKWPGLMSAAVLKTLEDPDSSVCTEAVRGLASQFPKEVQIKAVPALSKLILRDDAELQELAFITLRDLGPAARDAAPAIIELLKTPHQQGNRAIIRYRPAIPPQAPFGPREMPPNSPIPQWREMPGSNSAVPLPEPKGVKKMPASSDYVPQPQSEPIGPGHKMPVLSNWQPIQPGTFEMSSAESDKSQPKRVAADPTPVLGTAENVRFLPRRGLRGMKGWQREFVPFDEIAAAIEALEAIGPDARAAVPVLRQMLKTYADQRGAIDVEAVQQQARIRRALAKIEADPANPPGDNEDDE